MRGINITLYTTRTIHAIPSRTVGKDQCTIIMENNLGGAFPKLKNLESWLIHDLIGMNVAERWRKAREKQPQIPQPEQRMLRYSYKTANPR